MSEPPWDYADELQAADQASIEEWHAEQEAARDAEADAALDAHLAAREAYLRDAAEPLVFPALEPEAEA